MTITSVGAPVNGLSNNSVNSPPSNQGGVTAATQVTEFSQVHLSSEARQLSAQSTQASQSMNADVASLNSNPPPEKEDSSWFEDALDSILPDDSVTKEDDCTCTVGKYLKAAASIGSVIALFI
ncbi:hypothetical protein FM037_23805 [Shewanella psychropiezotolerans]|uniref:Uncharacterized protein n=1 Tax=Shewanella psychropiezotolerans TaxID=2593655 RepID=A0ABX5X314_9GAMM|nr:MULTISPECIES: hypothetical protein [Shewanella]MPY23695.1 hypothetical protein [Shewanella sp. YLB-07]QDO85737.1 hypothetical protein FM037_23805 [Shewanella psychropiezotolerans]